MTDGDTADDLLQAPWDTVSDAEDADESVPEVIDDKALVEFFSDELGKSAAEVKKLREENIWLNGQRKSMFRGLIDLLKFSMGSKA